MIRGVEGFEGRSRLRTWVLGIVANIARRRGVRDGRVLPADWLDGPPAPAVDPRG